MIIKCNKELKVKQVRAILELESWNERRDISSFLKNKLNSEDSLDIKVKKLRIKPLGLIDNENNLTPLGEEAIETDCIWEKEKGEYLVSLIIDPFLSKIINIERADATSNEKNTIFSELSITNDIITSFKDKNCKFKPLKKTDYYIALTNYEKHLNLNWTFENSGKNIYSILEGNYGMDDSLESSNSKNISLDTFMTELAQSNNHCWNEKLKRLEVDLAFTKNDTDMSFLVKHHKFEKINLLIDNKQVQFDNIWIKDLQIMPNSPEVANKWYYNNLKKYTSYKYLSPKEFEEYNNTLMNRKEMHYLDESFSYFNYLSKVEEDIKRSENQKCYWHLKAPIDLSPNHLNNVKKTLYKNKDDIFTISELISEIKQNKKMKSIILFDQHILTDITKEKTYIKDKYNFLNKFLNAIDSDITFEIYTNKNSMSNLKYIDDLNLNIIFYENKCKDKHPRNLIFIYEDNSYDLWRLDRTMDLITYDTIDFDLHTKGNSRSFSLQNLDINTLEGFSKSLIEERLN